MGQWLRLRAPNAEGPRLIPGLGTKIPFAAGLLSSQTAARESLCPTSKTQYSQNLKKKFFLMNKAAMNSVNTEEFMLLNRGIGEDS